ncbi:hypothetical protein A4R44_00329 [Amycolatopsis sp. M39]|nr:hypothetical protein A4R44_00329 [Amycolatopsis sp. M39]
MAAKGSSFAYEDQADSAAVVWRVCLIMGTGAGLTFLFGFGNVLSLALRPGVPPHGLHRWWLLPSIFRSSACYLPRVTSRSAARLRVCSGLSVAC